METDFCSRRRLPAILSTAHFPIVFRGAVAKWRPAGFDLDDWERFFAERVLSFRVGGMPEITMKTEPELEPDSAFAKATFKEFRAWCRTEDSSVEVDVETHARRREDDLGNLDAGKAWAYFDYKYLPEVFRGGPAEEFVRSVRWDILGHPDRTAEHSTLWLGTKGAHTAGHYDTYGYNLVAQLRGQKLWVLFSPDDGEKYLKPTRVPFEESSVYSQLRISPMRACDLENLLSSHPDYRRMVADDVRPMVVVLNPGDAMFVPSHWWHFVSSCSDNVTIALNTWVELPGDHLDRLGESATRLLLYSLSQKYILSRAGCADDETEARLIFDKETRLMDVEFDDALQILVACKNRLKSGTDPADVERACRSAAGIVSESGEADDRISFQRVDASRGWERLLEILKSTFPERAPKGAPPPPREPLLETGGGASRSSCNSRSTKDEFAKFLRAVTHPKTIRALIEVLLEETQ